MQLLTARELDSIFRWPPGRAMKLVKAGRIPHVVLPDGEIRFDESEIERLLRDSRRPAEGQEVATADA